MPQPAGLTVVGQRVLAILVFSVIVWITEAVSYAVSALLIISALIVLLGFSPAPNDPKIMLGTLKAIPLAFSGFVNSAWVLVSAGLCISVCMFETGLQNRIILKVLSVVGSKTNNIIAGMIIVAQILALFIPATAARAATMTPIALGLITAFNIDRKSVFARQLMMTVGLATAISGIGLLTASSPNPYVVSFIAKALHRTITWADWFVYAEPLGIAMAIILYYMVTRFNKFEFDEIPGGRQTIAKALSDLGPMNPAEKRIAVIFVVTIALWVTEKWHHIDSNSVAVLSVTAMLMPYIGVTSWKAISGKVAWGTILLFGAGLSLGEIIFSSGAAVWMAKVSLGSMGLERLTPPNMMAIIVVAIVIIRFAFSSILSAAVTVVPTILGLLLGMNNPDLPIMGMLLISTYTVYFAFILPVNAPHVMIPYATDTFEIKDCIRVGGPLTLAGIVLVVLFSYTYWSWLGLM
jgi:solute carrier family 13 (sodium-dependent dicarboxylate transporter), member 2/3/5